MRYIILLIMTIFLILSKYSKKYKKVFIFLSGFTLVAFASFRGLAFEGNYAGNDYLSYNKWFNSVENVTLSWKEDIGFNLLMLLVKKVTGSFEVFIIISSSFFVYAIYHFAIKNSKDYIITIFLFVTFGIFELGLSAIRQWIAGSIFLLAFKFIREKNFWKYSISIILAATFHNSAIILLAIYPFINANMKFKYKIIITILIALLFTATAKNNLIIELIYKYFPSYKYKYLNIGQELNSNYTVFIISMLCLFIIMLSKKSFLEKNKNSEIYLDYLILLCLFSFTATLNPMYGRLLEYFMPAIPLIMPNIITTFPDRQKSLALSTSTMFFLAVYIL